MKAVKKIKQNGLVVGVVGIIGGGYWLYSTGLSILWGKDRYKQHRYETRNIEEIMQTVSDEEVQKYRKEHKGAKYLSDERIKEKIRRIKSRKWTK